MIASAGSLRVVFATDSRVPSGVGEHMLALAHALRPSWNVVLAFSDQGDARRYLDRAREAGFEVRALVDGAEPAFADWLGRSDAALLHVHAGIGWEGHDLAAAGRAAGVPIVRTEHLPYLITDARQRREHETEIERVDHLILVSQAMMAGFVPRGPRDRVSLVRNGVAVPIVQRHRAATRRALGFDARARVVLNVARFAPQKGHADLLAALPDIVKRFPDARFVFVGDGPDRARLQALTQAMGLGAQVQYLGERRDVPDLMAAADLFVLPSHFEGLPLVILEAMAMGMPIVATRVGGTVEALGEDYPWLPAPGAPMELAARIEEALGDRDRRRSVGLANRRRYNSEFQAERMAAETAAIYHRVARVPVDDLVLYG